MVDAGDELAVYICPVCDRGIMIGYAQDVFCSDCQTAMQYLDSAEVQSEWGILHD